VLERDGGEHFDRSCEKRGGITERQKEKEYLTDNKKKEG
jgi:hypothetical protein